MIRSVLAPQLPESPRPFVFPTTAAIAPLIMGLALWAISRQPFALLFGVLGPVIAIGSWVDSRWQARRLTRREAKRFARELVEASCEVQTARAAELSELETAHPSATTIATAARDPGEGWGRGDPPIVRLALAVRPSTIDIEGMPRASRSRSPEQLSLDDLCATSSTLDPAPHTVEVSKGIGVLGGSVLAKSAARAVVLQLAWLLRPDEWTIVGSSTTEKWVTALPHGFVADGSAPWLRFETVDGRAIVVAAASENAALPIALDAVVDTAAPWRILRSGLPVVTPSSIDSVTAAEAGEWAGRAARRARELGITRVGSGLPSRVEWGELEVPETVLVAGGLESDGLGARVGMTRSGACDLDLVSDGPHAVVGGTTGSGKSELLITWVLALVAARSPQQISVLLVDFKGGASFAPLARLRHCVGLVTDLDASTAQRALSSLSAELQYREKQLAELGVHSIERAPGLGRLVIAVDEFASLAGRFPELAALFTDIAARGRSLGMHLILCTQRPAGIVRDSLLANISLRVSLRVHDSADSVAVIGVGDAAELGREPVGRALVATGGGQPTLVQWAVSSAADIARSVERSFAHAAPRRPWLDPLPESIDAPSAGENSAAGETPAGVVIGRLDLPAEQQQPLVSWLPARDGNVLVLGAARSGKSGAVATLSANCFTRGDPVAAWHSVFSALAEVRRGVSERTVVAIDDVDVVLARMSPEHAVAFSEGIIALGREGSARGTALVVAAHRLPTAIHPLAALCPNTLLLRLNDKNEHVLNGGRAIDFSDTLPPGRGWWRGDVIQVVATKQSDAAIQPLPHSFRIASQPAVAVASTRPREFTTRLLASHPGVRILGPGDGELAVTAGVPFSIILGDVDSWNARWGALAALRGSVPIVIDNCSVADYRALLRDRDVPPPLAHPSEEVWLIDSEGPARRGVIV